MKNYLNLTFLLFGGMAVVHVARAVAEWNHMTTHLEFAITNTLVIVVSAALATWAWRLRRAPHSQL